MMGRPDMRRIYRIRMLTFDSLFFFFVRVLCSVVDWGFLPPEQRGDYSNVSTPAQWKGPIMGCSHPAGVAKGDRGIH